MSFQQQTAIITGGSSGIGKAIAKILVSQGFQLAIIARDHAKLILTQEKLKAIKKYPEQKILIYVADVSDRRQAEQAITSAITDLGTPDLLITSAGIVYSDYFEHLPIEVFEETMAVNYFGTLYCLKAVFNRMKQEQKGHIVLVSSGAGLMGIYGYSAYSPSKFAIRGLAESLRPELKLWGINLSVVYPPDTDTPQLEQENKTKPPETKAITGKAKTWSAEAVAQAIIQGIQQKSFVITPGLEMSLLAKLHSLFATQIHQYFDRTIAKVRN